MRRLLAVMLICVLAITCIGCGKLIGRRTQPGSSNEKAAKNAAEKVAGPEATVKVFLLTGDSKYIVPLTLKAPLEKDPPTTALDLMVKWGTKDDLKSPFPAGAELKSVDIKNGLATADFTFKSPVTMTKEDESKLVNSVVLTLSEFPDAKKVMLTKDGKKVQTLAGNVDVSMPLSAPVVINSDGSVAKEKTMKITIWYPYKATYMVPVTKFVAKSVAPARAAVEELLKGPKNLAGLDQPIPDKTRLLGIKIKDEVCWVDFSKEMTANHPGGTTGESSTINSIVYTLTEFSNVKSVRILTEGKEGGSIAGHISLDTPLERGYVNLRRTEDLP